MGAKQIVAILVCVAVVAVAVVYTVKKQSGPSGPPKQVLDQERTYACAKCGELQKMALGDFMKLAEDPVTKYRTCPKCGEMGLALAGECPHCHQMIPAAPANATDSYPCPKCKKNVIAAPGLPEPPAPAN